MLQDDAYAVIRFKADNPGTWQMHCHVEVHTVSGLIATIIEAPELLSEPERGGLNSIPNDHLEACKTFPMPYSGNAAGNMKDPLDLKGANTEIGGESHG